MHRWLLSLCPSSATCLRRSASDTEKSVSFYETSRQSVENCFRDGFPLDISRGVGGPSICLQRSPISLLLLRICHHFLSILFLLGGQRSTLFSLPPFTSSHIDAGLHAHMHDVLPYQMSEESVKMQ